MISAILLLGLFCVPESAKFDAGICLNLALLAMLFMFVISRATQYVIDGDLLIIRYCYLFVFKVSIEKIKILKVISCPIDCGTNLLNDVTITFQNNKMLTITPRQTEKLVSAICRINGKIEVQH